MIGHLDRYLLRRVFGAFLIVLLGVAGLAVSLDVLANADDAIQGSDGVGGIGVYALARLPLIALKMAPIAGLLAALTTLLALARTGELAAAAALGASQGRTVRALLPAAIAIALALFAIGEVAVPPAAETLRAMGLQPFARIARPTDAVWLRDGDDIVRIARISADENTLTDLTIFRRSPDGRLAFEIRAQTAARDGAGWRLQDVVVLPSDGGAAEHGDIMNWPSPLGPESFKTLAAHPAELPLTKLRTLSAFPGASPKPAFFYDFWIQRKYAAPIASALLLLLAVPFAGRLTRGRSMATPLVFGLGAGFAYFVFENLATAAAESGAITAIAGAWGPPAILACAIAALAGFQEKPG